MKRVNADSHEDRSARTFRSADDKDFIPPPPPNNNPNESRVRKDRLRRISDNGPENMSELIDFFRQTSDSEGEEQATIAVQNRMVPPKPKENN